MDSRSESPDRVAANGPRSAEPRSDDEWIQVGRVLRPHGVRGEVKIEIESDVADRFAKGSHLWLKPKAGTRRAVEIDRSSLSGNARIGLKGFTDREQAAEIRGAVLQIKASQVPPAPDGFFYHFDLVGCRCIDRQLGPLGTVEEVIDDGGGSLLQIRHATGVLLVPFVDAFLVEVDLENQHIEVDLPEGLIETCISKS